MKMKMSTLIFLIFGSLQCSISKKKYPELPSFNLLLTDSTTILNTKDIPNGKPFLLIYFSPDCRECREETDHILKNITSFKNTKIFFVSIDPMDRIRLFQTVYKTDRYPNLILARDYEWSFPRIYKAQGTPYTVIYDKNRQLRGIFSGKADVNDMLNILNKIQ